MRMNVAKMHKDAATEVARHVVIHTPIWSGQATLNWTAHVGKRKPPRRFVSIPRSNARLRRGKDGKMRASTGTQGGFGDIVPDPSIVASANDVALSAIADVIQTYKHPVAITTDMQAKIARANAPKIYISNSIKYVGKLWSGKWKSNPRDLASQLDYGSRVVRQRRHLFRRP